MAKMLTILFGLTLILAVACGTAESPPETAAAPAAEPTAVTTAGETSQPTPVPQAASPPAEVEVNPGKLIIMVGDLDTERFHQVFATGTGARNYGRIVGGVLIETNERAEMVPGIAEDWEISANGLTWIFTIREGVKFHDGTDLTLEDVLWTLQHSFGPQAVEYVTSSAAVISRKMDRIELSGPNTVSLITKTPLPEFAAFLGESGRHYHVLPKRAELHNTEEELAYDRNPIGAGPMKLVSHVPASSMSFERFDDFYYQLENGFPEDRRMKFQSLDLFLVPEEATRVAALRAGEADIAPVSLATREQVEAGGGRLMFSPEGVYVRVKMAGCWEPQYPCHDKRVRQALDYAINKELIRDQLYGGPEVFQVKGFSFITPSTIGYNPDLDPWPFDPEKARQLLADAGYPGGQGFGKLIVNTAPTTAMPFTVEGAQLAAEFWKRELGLDVEVRVSDSAGISKRDRAGELYGQITWKDNETRRDTTSWINLVYGDPQNPTRLHEDPKLFRLVQETIQIVDADERAQAYAKLYPRLRDESYELGIGYANIPWGVAPRVVTWEPYPLAQWVTALHTITLK
jgi:peptide/nickel transport system substrate-binding protein